ncbi:hypothetical protein CDCA_CDCA07G2099 [Cyanidium caldarium]|uniref:RNA polymerase I-specific transcription initiation factor RRN3 n=1 Tax=Cyanidium caldarium TaxID=2771 RepID=A0AAV9IVA6_CYACA|nr:hypothetical protein CDCA_CDCA07G2099 [Cyanidium caldarium]|eukprot:ctg_166.g93
MSSLTSYSSESSQADGDPLAQRVQAAVYRSGWGGLSRRRAWPAAAGLTDECTALAEEWRSADADGEAQLLEAFTRCARHMGEANCDELVGVVLSYDFLHGERCDELFRSFAMNLVTSNARYVEPVLLALVRKFQVESAAALRAVHATVAAVLELYPSATVALERCVERVFPHSSRSAGELERHVRACLQTLEYAPRCTAFVVTCVVWRLVELDLEAVHAAKSVGSEDADLFEMDRELRPIEPAAGEANVDIATEALPAAKLDACLDHFLGYCAACEIGAQETVCAALLDATERHLLPTPRTRHVQFALLVFVGSAEGRLTEVMLRRLLSLLADPLAARSSRVSAALYGSSLVASSRAVSAESAARWVTALATWLHWYLEGASAVGSDWRQVAEQHLVFYAVTGALVYAIVSRCEDLTLSEAGRERLRSLRLARLLRSPMEPLRMLPTALTRAFGATLSGRQVLDLSDMESTEAETLALELFYPFEEYSLPLSVRHVRQHHRQMGGQGDPADEIDTLTSQEARGRRISWYGMANREQSWLAGMPSFTPPAYL